MAGSVVATSLLHDALIRSWSFPRPGRQLGGAGCVNPEPSIPPPGTKRPQCRSTMSATAGSRREAGSTPPGHANYDDHGQEGGPPRPELSARRQEYGATSALVRCLGQGAASSWRTSQLHRMHPVLTEAGGLATGIGTKPVGPPLEGRRTITSFADYGSGPIRDNSPPI